MKTEIDDYSDDEFNNERKDAIAMAMEFDELNAAMIVEPSCELKLCSVSLERLAVDENETEAEVPATPKLTPTPIDPPKSLIDKKKLLYKKCVAARETKEQRDRRIELLRLYQRFKPTRAERKKETESEETLEMRRRQKSEYLRQYKLKRKSMETPEQRAARLEREREGRRRYADRKRELAAKKKQEVEARRAAKRVERKARREELLEQLRLEEEALALERKMRDERRELHRIERAERYAKRQLEIKEEPIDDDDGSEQNSEIAYNRKKSDHIREIRLALNRLNKEKKMDNETKYMRNKRLECARRYRCKKMDDETDEQYTERLNKLRYYSKSHQRNRLLRQKDRQLQRVTLTDEERRQRKSEYNRMYDKRKREEETEEERQQRLQKYREQNRRYLERKQQLNGKVRRREKVTDPEELRRRKQQYHREYIKRRNELETPEQLKQRKERERVNRKRFKERHQSKSGKTRTRGPRQQKPYSAEEKERRRAKNREYYQRRIKNETPEQRAKRLQSKRNWAQKQKTKSRRKKENPEQRNLRFEYLRSHQRKILPCRAILKRYIIRRQPKRVSQPIKSSPPPMTDEQRRKIEQEFKDRIAHLCVEPVMDSVVSNKATSRRSTRSTRSGGIQNEPVNLIPIKKIKQEEPIDIDWGEMIQDNYHHSPNTVRNSYHMETEANGSVTYCIDDSD